MYVLYNVKKLYVPRQYIRHRKKKINNATKHFLSVFIAKLA